MSPTLAPANPAPEPGAIRAVLAAPGGGWVVMSAFPGLLKTSDGRPFVEPTRRDATLLGIRAAGARRLIVLVEPEELPDAAHAMLKSGADAIGLTLERRPIRDYDVPDSAHLADWKAGIAARRAHLAEGGTVAFCCRHGAGRSGLMAALTLMEAGLSAAEAIAQVRAGFSEAVETEAQEAWLAARERG